MNGTAFSASLAQFQPEIAAIALRLLGAIALFYGGRWCATQIQRVIRQIMTKARMDASLISFSSHFSYYGVIALVALTIMGLLGIETTSLVAMLGAASIAIGLALQGSLSNFAAGILLIIFHPFRVGDLIEGAGVTGIVEEIQLFTTFVLTDDNRLVVIPNSKLINDNIVNRSAKGCLRVDLVVGIDYEDNLQDVKSIISDVLSADARILKDPKPEIGVLELAENYIRLAIRPWTESRNYWPVYFHVYERLVERFREEGVTVPSTKQDVHIHGIPTPQSMN
ncbi:mechanosensitive ion channel family protein [Altericista sp. CCNU0014]|uniref:mechanosensitive ion channel family protein n=1 Tax=Altericista sp. CCNU0014 TaxID=3082949 RepID=UPI00384B6CFE